MPSQSEFQPAARKCAFALSENRATVEDTAAKADELIAEHCVVEPLNAAQRRTLIDYLQRRVAEHMQSDCERNCERFRAC